MAITNKSLATNIYINGSVVFGAGVDLAALSPAQLRAIFGGLAAAGPVFGPHAGRQGRRVRARYVSYSDSLSR